MGGENDVRGFQFYSISPVAYIPSSATVNVLNPDGSTRMQKTLVNGYLTSEPVAQSIPIYQIITPGGDTQGIFNFEYRIPIFGPVTMAPFFDAGVNKIAWKNQLTVNPGQITNLNNQFPEAAFTPDVVLQSGTQKPRMSTGLELQVVLPIVQAPFRIYYAYNPIRRARVSAAPGRGGPFHVPEPDHVPERDPDVFPGLPGFRAARRLPFHHRQNILESI